MLGAYVTLKDVFNPCVGCRIDVPLPDDSPPACPGEGLCGDPRGCSAGRYGRQGNAEADARLYYACGRPFEGLKTFLCKAEKGAVEAVQKFPGLNELMVHGMGPHKPGYPPPDPEPGALPFSQQD